MTQEELDALMSENSDIYKADSTDSLSDSIEETKDDADETDKRDSEENYQMDPSILWPPPPPNDQHKVVRQLDDVTKDSEKKATEMIDKLEFINNYFVNSERSLIDINKIVDKNIVTFSKLHEKFPNIATFKECLELNNEIKDKTKDIINDLQAGQDEVMMAMDAMQYQDIHRQKIERVINVMRALARYMNSLFEAKIEDEKRVSSAVYIQGDSNNEVVSDDDIEALIASLGQKK